MNQVFEKTVSMADEGAVWRLSDEIAKEKGFRPSMKSKCSEIWVNQYKEVVFESFYFSAKDGKRTGHLHVIIFNRWNKEQADKAAQLLTINND